MYVKAVVEYDGTIFKGFQIQYNEFTIQDEIQKALKRLFKSEINITYASRTDSGTHSKGQVISFKVPYNMLVGKIQVALNNILNGSVIVKEVSECSREFNPRYDAKSKLYVYRILNQSVNDYMLKNFVWLIPKKLNWENIKKGVQVLKGEHDFLLFSSGCEEKTTRIKILDSDINSTGNLYEITFNARYFLTYMVRYLVGFLVAIGKGKEDISNFKKMLEGRGEKCRYCAPAKGLELSEIVF